MTQTSVALEIISALPLEAKRCNRQIGYIRRNPPAKLRPQGPEQFFWPDERRESRMQTESSGRSMPVAVKRARLRADIAGQRVLMATMWLRVLVEKANFNPSQPRIPAGDPAGGQWTGEGGTQIPIPRPNPVRGVPVPRPNPLRAATPAAPVLPKAPSNANIDNNIKEAEAHKLDYWWFRDQVHNKGQWDYKQSGHEYADFGNFNFGATGLAAGFSEDTLLRMAGWAQVQAGTSKPEWGTPVSLGEALLGFGGEAPFGDDPADQAWIKRGFEYYKHHKSK